MKITFTFALTPVLLAGTMVAHAAVTYDAHTVGDFYISSISSSGNGAGLWITAGTTYADFLNEDSGSAHAYLNSGGAGDPVGFVIDSSTYDPLSAAHMVLSPYVSGTSDGGYAHSMFDGEAAITLINTSADSFNVTLGLYYDLAAHVDPLAPEGSYGHAFLDVGLSDFADPNDFFGGPAGFTADLWAETYDPAQVLAGSESFVLSIGPNQTKTVSILFNAEGEITAVPVPAAFWLLGPVLVGLRRWLKQSGQAL